jgi:putative CocE/NonD family hydrolase
VPLLESYGEWLAHPDRDDYWQASAIDELYETIDVPALHIAGWYDIFLKGTLENYVGLRNRAASEHARANQRLVVTPWAHTNPNEIVGELWFGPEAGLPLFGNLHQWRRTFFETFLNGGGPVESPPVRIFVMGANCWRDEDDWPLRRAADHRHYLRSEGRLTREAPAEEAPDEFLYDPADPVTTVGGNTLFPFPTAAGGLFAGARDRRGIRDRPDVLCYTGEALREDLEVTGPLKATIYVSTSARDTDFTLALVDVYPDGRAIGIADGILRLRYRENFARQRLATPGDVYEIEIDLAATSNVFKAGHRIGVEVSSSNFPRFDRNPNYGGTIAKAIESDFVVARQHIFHDTNRASYITLPVVP